MQSFKKKTRNVAEYMRPPLQVAPLNTLAAGTKRRTVILDERDIYCGRNRSADFVRFSHLMGLRGEWFRIRKQQQRAAAVGVRRDWPELNVAVNAV